jgi:uncharacterized membrane protein YczE
MTNESIFKRPDLGEILHYLVFALIIALPVTIIMTVFYPSVSESTHPELGQCDIYYDDVFIPCVDMKTAFKVNLLIILSCSIVMILVGTFIDLERLDYRVRSRIKRIWRLRK